MKTSLLLIVSISGLLITSCAAPGLQHTQVPGSPPASGRVESDQSRPVIESTRPSDDATLQSFARNHHVTPTWTASPAAAAVTPAMYFEAVMETEPPASAAALDHEQSATVSDGAELNSPRPAPPNSPLPTPPDSPLPTPPDSPLPTPTDRPLPLPSEAPATPTRTGTPTVTRTPTGSVTPTYTRGPAVTPAISATPRPIPTDGVPSPTEEVPTETPPGSPIATPAPPDSPLPTPTCTCFGEC